MEDFNIFLLPYEHVFSYLRVVLNHKRGATSSDDLKTVNNQVYDSFKEVCYRLGLLYDDKEYIEGIKEASFTEITPFLKSFCDYATIWPFKL